MTSSEIFADDNNLEVASGTQADTFYDEDTRLTPTTAMLDIQRRVDAGELSKDDATILLDSIATQYKR